MARRVTRLYCAPRERPFIIFRVFRHTVWAYRNTHVDRAAGKVDFNWRGHSKSKDDVRNNKTVRHKRAV